MESIRVEIEPDEEILATLQCDEHSKPYYVNKANNARSCRFDLFRGVTYILAFLIGIATWIREIVTVGFGYRSTYAIPTDEEFAKLFETPFPYGVWAKRSKILSNAAPSRALDVVGSDAASDAGLEIHLDEEEVLELSTEDIAVADAHTLPGTYIKPVKMIFRSTAGEPVLMTLEKRLDGVPVGDSSDRSPKWRLYSVEVDNQLLFAERDGETHAWHMTKLFALQAIHYFILMKRHPFTHFQQEKLIAATHYLFPDANHELRKLLDPHCDFTSDINFGVLETKKSPLFAEGSSYCCWNAHTFNREGNQKIIGRGYEILSSTPNRFGDVPTPELQPHYDAILKLTTAVVTSMITRIESHTDDSARNLEYSNIAAWLGFMERHLYYPVNLGGPASGSRQLASLLADNIFDVSVRHSVEHHYMARSDQRLHHMMIVKPWSRDVVLPHTTGSPFCAWRCGFGPNSSGSVVPMGSWLKQLMYNALFAEWTNNRLYCDGRLHTTDHRFVTADLQQADDQFRNDIAALPETFISKDRIARSIQW